MRGDAGSCGVVAADAGTRGDTGSCGIDAGADAGAGASSARPRAKRSWIGTGAAGTGTGGTGGTSTGTGGGGAARSSGVDSFARRRESRGGFFSPSFVFSPSFALSLSFFSFFGVRVFFFPPVPSLAYPSAAPSASVSFGRCASVARRTSRALRSRLGVGGGEAGFVDAGADAGAGVGGEACFLDRPGKRKRGDLAGVSARGSCASSCVCVRGVSAKASAEGGVRRR